MALHVGSKRTHAESDLNDSANPEISIDEKLQPESAKRACLAQSNLAQPPNKDAFPFLSLPGELRNKIYEYCFPIDDPISSRPHPKSRPHKPPVPCSAHLRSVTIRYKPKLDPVESAAYLSASHKNPKYVNDDNSIRRDLRDAERYGRGERPRRFMCCMNGYPNIDGCPHYSRKRNPTAVAILAVCKQTYKEAAPMLYSQYLMFQDVDALISFASSLSPRTAKLIRHVEVKRWYSATGSAKRLRLRGQTAMAILAEKGVTELETLKLGYKEAGASGGQVLRRSSRRG